MIKKIFGKGNLLHIKIEIKINLYDFSLAVRYDLLLTLY